MQSRILALSKRSWVLGSSLDQTIMDYGPDRAVPSPGLDRVVLGTCLDSEILGIGPVWAFPSSGPDWAVPDFSPVQAVRGPYHIWSFSVFCPCPSNLRFQPCRGNYGFPLQLSYSSFPTLTRWFMVQASSGRSMVLGRPDSLLSRLRLGDPGFQLLLDIPVFWTCIGSFGFKCSSDYLVYWCYSQWNKK